MTAISSRGAHQKRHGYKPVANQSWPFVDPVSGLVKSAIDRSQKQDQLARNTFIKRKSNGDLQIVKVVNSLLRSTVLITYPRSHLNESKIVVVDYKRYRHNTVDQFGQPCRDTERKSYDLNVPQQAFQFVADVEEHMRISPENLKTNNVALPLRMHGFDHIGEDSLYAMEIHAFNVIKSDEGALESVIDMSLASDNFTRDFAIKVKDIINFNDISKLVGKWVVFNFRDAFKIKSKEELQSSYRLLH
jgi:hypothetical protein